MLALLPRSEAPPRQVLLVELPLPPRERAPAKRAREVLPALPQPIPHPQVADALENPQPESTPPDRAGSGKRQRRLQTRCGGQLRAFRDAFPECREWSNGSPCHARQTGALSLSLLIKKPGRNVPGFYQVIAKADQLSRNDRSLRERLGCFSFRSALASI
ncbi:hypothetical protein LAX5112_04710 [Roseibium alexandrii]|uniref:Uncharacterized protein n=1 Tax=Roseibium alexandrii TaxID=388408 RepID=A0A0M7ANW0_9HYPH|nr:hypothetical protein LAX5112_04710 [Roseibium alexandrii]